MGDLEVELRILGYLEDPRGLRLAKEKRSKSASLQELGNRLDGVFLDKGEKAVAGVL